MVNENVAVEPTREEGYIMPIAGATVTQCRIDFAFTLIFRAANDDIYELRIQCPFTFEIDGNAGELDPGNWSDPCEMGLALKIFNQVVDSAAATPKGLLAVRLRTGGWLMIHPDAEHLYEAWVFSGGERTLVVCNPDGELAIWT